MSRNSSRRRQPPDSRSSADTQPQGNPSRPPDSTQPVLEREVQQHVQEFEVAKAELFEGPIPHPNHLAEYDRIVPGAGKDIIQMAKDQAEHRRGLESAVVHSKIKQETRGQWFGFVIAMTALFGGIYLIDSGKSLWGAATAISAIAGLVALFVWSKRQQKRELREKADPLAVRRVSKSPSAPPSGPDRS